MGAGSALGIGVLVSYGVSNVGALMSADRMTKQLTVSTGAANTQLTALALKMKGVAIAAGVMAAGMALIHATVENVRAYATYQESMLQVQGLLNQTTEGMAEMEAQSFELARATRYTAGEIMDANWELISAGYAQEEVMYLIEAALQAAVIGNMEAKDATDMLTAATKAFNIPVEEASRVVDVLTAGVRYSKIHFEEYSRALGTFGGVAAGLNQDLETTASLFGLIRTRGLSASRSSMQVKMLYTNLIGMSDANRELMHGLDVAMIDPITGEFRDLNLIIGDLLDALPEVSELMDKGFITEEDITTYAEGRLSTFTNLLGKRAVAALFNVATAQMTINDVTYYGIEAWNAMEDAMRDSSGYAQEYYDILMSGLNEQFRVLDSSVQLLKAQLGSALGAAAAPLLTQVIDAVNAVSTFLEKYPQIAAGIGVGIAAAGVIMSIVGAVGLIAGLAKLIPAVIIKAMVSAAIAAGWIILAIIAAIVLVIIFWDEITGFLSSLWTDYLLPIWNDTIKPLFEFIWTRLTHIWKNLVNMWPAILTVLKVIGAALLAALVIAAIIAAFAVAIVAGAFAFVVSLWDEVISLFLWLGNAIGEVAYWLSTFIPNLISEMDRIANVIVESIKSAFMVAVQWVKNMMGFGETSSLVAQLQTQAAVAYTSTLGGPTTPITALAETSYASAMGHRAGATTVSEGWHYLHDDETEIVQDGGRSNRGGSAGNTIYMGGLTVNLTSSGYTDEDAREIADMVQQYLGLDAENTIV